MKYAENKKKMTYIDRSHMGIQYILSNIIF